jgi:3-hydroxybutyryl-CoA dehydrogenase
LLTMTQKGILMSESKMETVAVLGAGLMGTGIAQVVATGGYNIYLKDVSQDILDRSKAEIDKRLKRLIAKKKMTPKNADAVMDRITFTVDTETAVKSADFITEAVPEDLALKKKVFTEIDHMAKPSAIFASNTSELSITSLAEATSRKEKVIGTHWFFPPQVMKLIEVVVAPGTSKETIQTTLNFCETIGKETVTCKDMQGFITSRAISALVAECLRVYEDGIASIEDIDKAMRLGFNHPIGPFQLVDMSGLDVVYHSLEALSKKYGDRFKPTETMSKLVQEGNLGQKTGKGFYDYKPR